MRFQYNQNIAYQKAAIKIYYINEPFKAEIIANRTKRQFSNLSTRESGFIDLCRGPHLRNLKQIGHFKLTKVSGAYWKGDANNTMLTEYMEQHGIPKRARCLSQTN